MQPERTDMKSKRLCKAEQSNLDIISTLLETILETILCLLPTKEAARTSILSRAWRYKWTKLPKLEFQLSDVYNRLSNVEEVMGSPVDMECKLYDEIHQILLSRTSPIHEFTLYVDLWYLSIGRQADDFSSLEQIILHLSKNHTIKKFELRAVDYSFCYSIPISVFSLHHLTDLYLSCVDFNRQPAFIEFSNLKSLVLDSVEISAETLLDLLSNSPSLKSLSLTGYVGLDDRSCTIIELFECIPVIEQLTISGYVFEWLVLGSVPKELPTSLFHLKYFCFEDMCFIDNFGLAFFIVLIKCSPNLEKIKLEIMRGHECNGEYSVVLEEYSDVWLEHLAEFEIKYFGNKKPEMELVKFILARSPNLKKVSIIGDVDPSQQSKMLGVLLEAPRASPVIISFKDLYERPSKDL